ncbi:hypothetical protein QT06_C0001G0628 [archaeon GW2011_AR15]|nr:hypothetical protein QT06_C0001G0628 [archaeon GW2011_AR15]MBS3103584.1 WbuC family cupin fold metalloprotein [Candidatus Woesearchaeota archaeon]
MNLLNSEIIEKTLQEARKSERGRAIFCFHKKTDGLQRMVNAVLKETYLRPHKHENPDKLEIFSIVKGKVAILTFDDSGRINEKRILDENDEIKIAEIPPKTWHNFVVLSKEAVLYEIIDGKYNPKTHKKEAKWAPEENTPAAKIYLTRLRKETNNG